MKKKFKKLFLSFLILSFALFNVTPAHAVEVDGEQVHKIVLGAGLALSTSGGTGTFSAAAAAITSGTIAGVTIENSVIGAATPVAATFTTATAVDVISTHYLQMYSFGFASTRVASGAPAGSTIAIEDAAAIHDCGVTGGGSLFVICISDGTNWISIGQTRG